MLLLVQWPPSMIIYTCEDETLYMRKHARVSLIGDQQISEEGMLQDECCAVLKEHARRCETFADPASSTCMFGATWFFLPEGKRRIGLLQKQKGLQVPSKRRIV
jgi:hypothetical protein